MFFWFILWKKNLLVTEFSRILLMEKNILYLEKKLKNIKYYILIFFYYLSKYLLHNLANQYFKKSWKLFNKYYFNLCNIIKYIFRFDKKRVFYLKIAIKIFKVIKSDILYRITTLYNFIIMH